MRLDEAKRKLEQQLREKYSDREPQIMADMVMEKLTGYTKVEWLLHNAAELSNPQAEMLLSWAHELLQYRPIQYVLSEAWFMNRPFYVKEGVLIPRPETEELVHWIAESPFGQNSKVSLLDIGTGSGCIAVSLDLLLPSAEVTGVDISSDALAIAERNNRQLNANVHFETRDILSSSASDLERCWDVIVSNPPYIRNCEQEDMAANVLQYESAQALFVEDNDPLLFYRKIAELGKSWLKNEGLLYFEINEHFGKETVSLLSDLGYQQVALRQDLQGKDRMVKAMWLVN